MQKQKREWRRPQGGGLQTLSRRFFHALMPLVLFVACVLAQGGCTCSGEPHVLAHGEVRLCRARTPGRTTAPPRASGAETVPAGTVEGTFSTTSAGGAAYVMRLSPTPGRAGVEPQQLALTYDSAGGDGVLGVGFSLAGMSSSIARCAQNLAQDGEIRGVRYDAADKLCLDGKRLVPVKQAPGTVEFRTFPDTQVKVIGHYAAEGEAPGNALSFEAFMPSGLVVEYGTGDGSKPLARAGVPRAWLAARAHDGRGNFMTYDYCFADADGTTAEVALDEIRYTGFDGTPALEPSRAVKLVYGTKDPADVRSGYSGGVEIQSSLRLDEIQMLGPGDTLVRRYGFTYGLGPTTHRTLLTQVEECAGDEVCKPPTRFQFSSRAAGFKRRPTTIPKPTSTKASPMLFDMDGDGLDDLVLPDASATLSTPESPLTEWRVARNQGSPPYLAPAALAFSEEWLTNPDPSGPADPAEIQPDLGTAIDYDQDGRTDVLIHDVYDTSPTWSVLLAQPDKTFKVHDTGIRRPFPLGSAPKPPTLTSAGGSMHLADLDGNGVPDMILCQDHGETATGDPSRPAWAVHLWTPAHGATPAGFDLTGEPLEPLAGFRCDTELYTLDLNADSKVDLVVQAMLTFGDGTKIPASTYNALSRRSDGSWEVFDTRLPTVAPGGRVVFLDVNGDGLPDAIESGFSDHALRAFVNTGSTFAAMPGNTLDFNSLTLASLPEQDIFFRFATPIDFNNDGRQDLLMPVPGGTLPGRSDALPAWAVLQATGAWDGPTFAIVDPDLPFEAAIGEDVTLADPRGPRIGDLNGDGAQDVVLALGGVFNVFENLAADQDLLIAVSDGMNAHDPGDPGFVPDVSISYGHLTDAWITRGAAAGDPERESTLYLSHADAANDCVYPRTCAVGPRRVVRAYATNNGADQPRHFGVRYRDGRYHRLGRGFLGFGERIITDLETGAGTAEFYDNITYDDTDGLKVFPFAGQVQREWRWFPGLPSQPEPEKIELSFADVTWTVFPTNDQATYFTRPTERRVRREQGILRGPVEAYVERVESRGGATVLRDTVTKASDIDPFGNVQTEDLSIQGVDLTLHVERTFKNDTERWVLGQLQTQKECSAAAGLSPCRTLTRTTTIHGEVETEATASDDGSLETKLSVVYARDPFGNIKGITADDAFGHHRSSGTTYDPEGIFPETHTNAANHKVLEEYDPGLGVLTKQSDPNQLVTQWAYDGFGRLGLETRPDGTQTTITRFRTHDGGLQKDAWRVLQRTHTPGGEDATVEVDSLGRPIRWWWHGASPLRATGAPPRLTQEIAYDAQGEHVARRSVPVSEGTPESQVLYDTYAFDALGREVRHTTPWRAVVKTSYDAAQVQVTDPLEHRTTAEHDPLGRPVAITDAALGVTRYTYGPFGALFTVTDPGRALTRTTRDAFGRVRQLDDPDRGTTVVTYDGFGEQISSTDALSRVITLGYDALGRTISRLDQHGAERLTTTWTWDTADHGIGKLQEIASPEVRKTSTYDALGRIETLTIAVEGESEPLQGGLGYDGFGRVATITYPRSITTGPFVVAQEYDDYGHVVAVRDEATRFPYWRLTDVDDAGRYRKEVLGNEVTTERSYFDDERGLKSIVTHGATPVQNLAYEYDLRRDLKSRTDALQPRHPTERFRYDALERLKCTYFGATESASAPCALGYDYAPNGNLTFKSDVGTLAYDDPTHPHAVTAAGTDRFAYDAAGDQIARPGGETVTYSPFDLPARITNGTGRTSFAYDGDGQRIRKQTPDVKTRYFGDLHERFDGWTDDTRGNRYYVHSPERVVAVVTRGGLEAGTRYLHVDHLGSLDAVTDEGGTVVEHRSYDPFGQRRNPVWEEPVPASFASLTTRGFTGHESDDEVGLINMKGRVFDPKIGRFLTPDPFVSAPLSGQGWNPYGYVRNNPLNYVDPSGFADETPNTAGVSSQPVARFYENILVLAPGATADDPSGNIDDPRATAFELNAAPQPLDVGTTGSASGYVPQPVTTAQADWIQSPRVQVAGGFLSGLLLSGVPYAGVGQQLLDAADILPHGTPEARLGLALGQIVGGFAYLAGGLGGEVLGGMASVTGAGAVVGIPAMVVSTGLVLGGVANIAAGIRGLSLAVMSQGSGSTGPQGTAPAAKGGIYTLTDPKTGEVVRTGRTNDLARRQAEHARDPKTKKFDFNVDKRTDVYAEQRGREQIVHNQHEPPLNKINPVSSMNPRYQDYLEAAKRLE